MCVRTRTLVHVCAFHFSKHWLKIIFGVIAFYFRMWMNVLSSILGALSLLICMWRIFLSGGSLTTHSSWRDAVGVLNSIVLVQDCVAHWRTFCAMDPPSTSNANNFCKAHNFLCHFQNHFHFLMLPKGQCHPIGKLCFNIPVSIFLKVQHIKAHPWRPKLPPHYLLSKDFGFHLDPIPPSVSPHSMC